MHTLERLSQFRQQVYHTCTRRATAMLEVIDAVAQVARPHSPAELSLVLQRHWSTRYAAVDAGRIDLAALRPLLAQTAAGVSAYQVAGCRVLIIDHSGDPRPGARTVAERECYRGPNATRQYGHRYSFLSQLVDATGTWLAPLDVDRIGPGSTPVGIALAQVARAAQSSAAPLIVIGDREYGVNDVLRVVPHLPGVPVSDVLGNDMPRTRGLSGGNRSGLYASRLGLTFGTTSSASSRIVSWSVASSVSTMKY